VAAVFFLESLVRRLASLQEKHRKCGHAESRPVLMAQLTIELAVPAVFALVAIGSLQDLLAEGTGDEGARAPTILAPEVTVGGLMDRGGADSFLLGAMPARFASTLSEFPAVHLEYR
jgi:hypothetical protein